MSQENVDSAKRLYEAFGQGDVPTIIGVFDPQIKWVEPEGSPTPGVFNGPQSILENVFAKFPQLYGQMEVVTQDFVDGENRLVVLGEYRLIDQQGRAITSPFAHVWNVKNGKFTSYQDYTDTSIMSRAVKQ